MKKIQHILAKQFFLLWLFLPLFTASATIINTYLTQDSLTIGDNIELTVSLVTPRGAQIIPPQTDGGIGKFIVKNWDTDRVERKSSDSLTYKYLLTMYTVEPCSIPALPYVEIKEDYNDTLYSLMYPMRVISVIDAQPGDTVNLKDIKPQQKAGTPSFLWFLIIFLIGFIAAGMYVGRYFRQENRKPAPPPPPKPPYDEAIEALALLENKQLLTKGLLREYVFELSEILKRYIGRRFSCNAAEFTTEEMLQWLPEAPFDAALSKSMEWFFDTTHPVKFARMVPDTLTVKKLLEETKSFIVQTKPSLKEEPPVAPAKEANQ